MLAIPELAMPKSRKATTVCNGRREVWTAHEEVKEYFLETIIVFLLFSSLSISS